MELGALNAVGVWFWCCETDRCLYLLRRSARYRGTWALPGGKIEPNETLLAAIQRECWEEMGVMPSYLQLAPIEQFTSQDQGFCYHTFFCVLEQEFVPKLNSEHDGYAWINSHTWPSPVHPGLWNTINLDSTGRKISQLTAAWRQRTPTTTSITPSVPEKSARALPITDPTGG